MIIAVPSEDSFLKYVTNDILNMPPHYVTRWPDETLKFISQVYNLGLLDIYHEKVQPIHKLWFITSILNCAFNRSNKLIDLSLKWKILNKFSSILARFILKGFGEEMLPYGHTVVAVYKKV